MVWPDGKVYRGFWKQGKQEGNGLLIDEIGGHIEGEWYQ